MLVLKGFAALGSSAALVLATTGVAAADCPPGDHAIWSAPTVPVPVTIHDLEPRQCYNVQGLLGERATFLANRTRNSVLNLFSEPDCGGGLFIDAIFPPGPGNRSESTAAYYSFNVSPLNGWSSRHSARMPGTVRQSRRRATRARCWRAALEDLFPRIGRSRPTRVRSRQTWAATAPSGCPAGGRRATRSA